MSTSGEDRERQVIPRWRSFASSAQFGELKPLTVRSGSAFSAEMLSDVLDDWRREPGLSVAADLVSAAIAVGFPQVAHEAARLVLDHEHAPEPARDIAARCLGGQHAAELFANPKLVKNYSQVEFEELKDKIHQTRLRLVQLPHNPVLWTNLALHYTTAGQPLKAERAMHVALSLAYGNRFVARAACRFFLHQGDVERAHNVLLRAPTLKQDPWLLAAEIAVASIRRKNPNCIKTARQIADGGRFSPFHLSELNGSLATLEAYAGNLKKSKKLCANSMIEPAENSVAQAAWLSRNIDENSFEALLPASPKSNEANAWISRGEGDWTTALSYAQQWQGEQPFSSRPALFGSHVASTGLEDFNAAEKVVRLGLVSNPNEASLINNLAFALAKQDKVEDAKQELNRALLLPASDETKICLIATEGLVEFRRGNSHKGRLLYQRAIATATAKKLNVLADGATIYLAIEESHMSSSLDSATINAANTAVDRLPSPLRETFRFKVDKIRTTIVL